MNRLNAIQTCRNTLVAAAIATAFGSVTIGCLPIGTYGLARYNTAYYSPNTDSTGFVGTWIVTLNNEIEPAYSDGLKDIYQRQLIRIRRVPDTTESYEFTACEGYDFPPAFVTQEAPDSTISLLLPGPGLPGQRFADFSITTNGRMQGTATLYGGTVTLRAVRISGNPNFNAGSVGFDSDTDSSGVLQHSTLCFYELQEVAPGAAIGNSYALVASGANGYDYNAQYNSIRVTENHIQGNSMQATNGDNYSAIGGPTTNATLTLTSDLKGVRGTVKTPGDESQSLYAPGTLIMDVTL